MTQLLKDHIRDALIDAALEEFAKSGFTGASIASIAKHAGVSTGNVYRYFANKSELFYAAVPHTFVHSLMTKFKKRIAAYPAGTRPDKTTKDSQYSILSEDLLAFTIANRLRVLITLEGAEGTDHEVFATKLKSVLTKNAIETLQIDKLSDNAAIISLLLDDLYNNFIRSTASILRQFNDEADIRTAISIYTRYHLGGLAMIAS